MMAREKGRFGRGENVCTLGMCCNRKEIKKERTLGMCCNREETKKECTPGGSAIIKRKQKKSASLECATTERKQRKNAPLECLVTKKKKKRSDGQKKKGRFNNGEIAHTLRMCYNKEKHRTSMPRRKKASMLGGEREKENDV
jgi:hypothetical protein